MDKDKSHHSSGSSLPPSGRYSPFTPNNNSSSMKPELPGSSNFPSLQFDRFSQDVSRMPENPRKNIGHRRAHSEILTLPDDISFDSDLGVVGGFDGPSFSDENEEDLLSMYLDMDKFNSLSGTSGFQVGESSAMSAWENTSADSVGEKPRIRHHHSQSMDGSAGMKPEMFMSGSDDPPSAESKKAASAAKLAELALIDPKRAKRVWANRQSAARSKERKMRYIAELEGKLQTLQTETTSLTAQVTLLQRDTSGLESHNNELKLRLQTMDQRVHLQDALNEALKEEIQHLKVVTGQAIPSNGGVNGGQMMKNFTPPSSSYGAAVNQQQYYNNNNNHAAAHTMLTAQQLQQLQIHQNPQQQNQFQPHQLIHQYQQQAAVELKSRGSLPSVQNHAPPDEY